MDRSGIIGIYLAAGKSRRMGANKLNLPAGKEWIGSIAFRAALESKLTSTIVVTRKEIIPQWLAPFSHTQRWTGMEVDGNQSDSLMAGINRAAQSGAKGVIVMLADQPFVPSQMINRLLDEFNQNPDYSFIAFSNNGLLKPPMFFSSKLFPKLMNLAGDQGARSFIRGEVNGKKIEVEDDIYFFDIDTKEDYESFCKKSLFNS